MEIKHATAIKVMSRLGMHPKTNDYSATIQSLKRSTRESRRVASAEQRWAKKQTAIVEQQIEEIIDALRLEGVKPTLEAVALVYLQHHANSEAEPEFVAAFNEGPNKDW